MILKPASDVIARSKLQHTPSSAVNFLLSSSARAPALPSGITKTS